MTLFFMTKWPDTNGSPTMFIDKIWNSLKDFVDQEQYHKHLSEYDRLGLDLTIGPFWYKSDTNKPKHHTIRKGGRFKKGNKIHFKVWTGLPRRSKTFAFAPVVECVSVQRFEIQWAPVAETGQPVVMVDRRLLYDDEIKELAINDGFDNVSDFYDYFDEDFVGQIIHWTDKKYGKNSPLSTSIPGTKLFG